MQNTVAGSVWVLRFTLLDYGGAADRIVQAAPSSSTAAVAEVAGAAVAAEAAAVAAVAQTCSSGSCSSARARLLLSRSASTVQFSSRSLRKDDDDNPPCGDGNPLQPLQLEDDDNSPSGDGNPLQ